MALSLLGHNPGVISPLGGGFFWMQEVNSDGSQLGSPDTYHEFGIIKDSEIHDEYPLQEYPDERGFEFYARTVRKVYVQGTTYQRDVGTLTWAPVDTNGKFYSIIKQVSYQKVNGLYQYLYAPICQIDGTMTFKTLGNDVPFKFVATANEAAFTNNGVYTGVSHAASVVFTDSGPTITVPQYGFYTWFTTPS